MNSLPIVTLSTGKIKPDLKGVAIYQTTSTYYLGENFVKTDIPEYEVRIEGSKGKFKRCQAGRDFAFV